MLWRRLMSWLRRDDIARAVHPITYFIIDLLGIIMSIIQVSDFMVIKPVTIGPDKPLIEVAIKMRENRIGSLILVENNKPIGIITERDLVWRVVANGLDINSLVLLNRCMVFIF